MSSACARILDFGTGISDLRFRSAPILIAQPRKRKHGAVLGRGKSSNDRIEPRNTRTIRKWRRKRIDVKVRLEHNQDAAEERFEQEQQTERTEKLSISVSSVLSCWAMLRVHRSPHVNHVIDIGAQANERLALVSGGKA